MSRFKKLQSGAIVWSSVIREWLEEFEKPNVCIYCEKTTPDLTTEHLLPRHRNGPDIPDNAVRVCKSCNSSKGSKRLYEWFGLLFALHEGRGTLDESIIVNLCPQCDLGKLCPEKATLSVFCLEGIFLPKKESR